MEENRRKRSITDADIDAIKEALMSNHVCLFDSETRQILKTITDIYRDGRSALLKAMVAALFVGFLYVAALGAGLIGQGKGG